LPEVQVCEAHSRGSLHGFMLPHVGAQSGGTQTELLSQLSEAQSELWLHGAPLTHEPAQAGEAHLPPVHVLDAQSDGRLHELPLSQVGAQPGGTHTQLLLVLQLSDAQSELWLHGAPSAHAPWHAGWAHLPLTQLSDVQSAPCSHA
jgi:hypothetical protein